MRSSKQVILIYPKIVSSDEDIDIPLNLLCLGSYLKAQGYEPKILNHYVAGTHFDRLLLKELDHCLCVGMTVMTAQLPDAMRIARLIKNRDNEIPIVFGGAHATLFPEQTVQNPLIDYAVVGEGELAFLELLQHIRENQLPEDVGGIAFVNRQKQIVCKREKKPFDFNQMPHMNFSLFSPELLRKTARYRIPIQTSRGCPYRCRFCINTILPEARKWRCWDIQRTVDEIEHVLTLNPRLISFYDEYFFSSKARIMALVAEIKKRGLKFKWLATIRANNLGDTKIDQPLLNTLGECGFQLANIGAESGSRHMLDLIQKDISPEDLLRSATMFNKAKIVPQYSFMIGIPGETRDDAIATVKIIREISAMCPAARFLGPQLFRPYPGSELYQECVTHGWSEPTSIDEWCEHMEQEMMHSTPATLPWIKDKQYVTAMWFYTIFIALHTRTLIKLFLQYAKEYRRSSAFTLVGIAGVIFFSWIAKLRYVLGFYAWLIEATLFKKYRCKLSS